MSFTEKQEQKMKKMPKMETQIRRSKDGTYLIHRTIISTIRPISYYKAIVENKEPLTVDELEMIEGVDLVV